LIEGEEEIGSPNFESLLRRERERLRCDAVVVSDTTMWDPDVPSMCVGMSGLVAFDITVRTSEIDLHSGTFGGAVPNAARLVAELATALHDEQGRIAGLPALRREPLPPAGQGPPAGRRSRPDNPGPHLGATD